MLDSNRKRIVEALGPAARVLDVGGWGQPLERADWVLDLMPHETRGLYPAPDYRPEQERFSAETWVQADICDHEPWPFADDEFDFAVCSHTLEDVRDPVWVCAELSRVARAGYVEVPSRLEEQSLGVHGPWVGWSHHHWLVDRDPDGTLRFVFKSHAIHGDRRFHFPRPFGSLLTPEERIEAVFWEGRIEAREEVFTEASGHDAYLSRFVARNSERCAGREGPGAAQKEPQSVTQRLLRRARRSD